MSRHRFGLPLVVTFSLMATGTLAQSIVKTETGTGAAIVQKLVACRELPEPAVRLACYDQAAAALNQAEAKGDIVVVDREQARRVRRQAFGLALPSLSLFEKGETREDLDNVTGNVASARQDASGRWVVKLDEGAVWTQVEVHPLSRSPRPGMSVRVRRASLGSYMMSIDGQVSFRARRAQ